MIVNENLLRLRRWWHENTIYYLYLIIEKYTSLILDASLMELKETVTRFFPQQSLMMDNVVRLMPCQKNWCWYIPFSRNFSAAAPLSVQLIIRPLFQVLESGEVDSEQEQRWNGWNPSSNFDGLPEPIEIPEEHHHDIAKIEEILAKEPLPRRVLSPGRALGLSVMLNVEESEYDCSGSESVGFKVSKIT